MKQKQNPFAFNSYKDSLKPDNPITYITPQKRKFIKEYLSNSNIQLKLNNDKDKYESTYQEIMRQPGIHSKQYKKQMEDVVNKQKQSHIFLGLYKHPQQSEGQPMKSTQDSSEQVNLQKINKQKQLQDHIFVFKGQINNEREKKVSDEKLLNQYLKTQRQNYQQMKIKSQEVKCSSIRFGRNIKTPLKNKKSLHQKQILNQTIKVKNQQETTLFLGEQFEKQKKQQEQSTCQLKSPGRFDLSNNYTQKQFPLGNKNQSFEQKVNIYGLQTLPNQQLQQLISKEPKNQSHLYLPKIVDYKTSKQIDQEFIKDHQTTVNQTFHRYKKNYSCLTRNNTQYKQDQITSHYQVNHNELSSRVDLDQQLDNSDKVKQYRERILQQKYKLGEDKEPLQSSARLHYETQQDQQKHYQDFVKELSRNKSQLSKHSYQLDYSLSKTPHKYFNKNQDEFRTQGKDDNRQLYESLKKSYLNMGSNSQMSEHKSKSVPYTKLQQDLRLQLNRIRELNEKDSVNKTFQFNSSERINSQYRDIHNWKSPRFDY